jgi:ATP-binding cassette subfamily B protein
VKKQSASPAKESKEPKGPSLLSVLKPYRWMIVLLILLTFVSNGLNLVLPQIIARGIDAYTHGTLVINTVMLEFLGASIFIFIFVYLQSIVQTYASEYVARDLRTELSAKISRQSAETVQELTPALLLTNLTSDIDAIKLFVSQAIVSIISSLLLIVGSAVLLTLINWKLALVVLLIIPIIGGTFFLIIRRVRKYFRLGQEVIDRLNRVINESILGSALIRVLHAESEENQKFLTVNTDARTIGLNILRMFSILIPIITFVSGMASISILSLGGYFVIHGSMSLGDLAAFNSYVAILIFPILIIGFMTGIITRASASFTRVSAVLAKPDTEQVGTIDTTLRGDIALKDVSIIFGEKSALKDVSFSVKAGTRTAIIGPTGAGKTQLLYLLTGLIKPDKGVVEYDEHSIDDYEPVALHRQIGFVFQDSILFNLSVRENIAFSDTVKDLDLEKAIETAELSDFIHTLPDGLNTVVSERGTSLSGGQKQRIMLARALALNPRVLLLDDFTARVDTNTERKILGNVRKNYPDLTLVSVTQKISSIEQYDHIILLMEGELLAQGTHEHLMKTSPEYVQIFDSQRSTNAYELQS